MIYEQLQEHIDDSHFYDESPRGWPYASMSAWHDAEHAISVFDHTHNEKGSVHD